ncbi:MAG TPA: tyrosine-type recombinase/integrase [Pseudonocardiaceae bacterium]|nr:tyrosine-type recombinase/integrase [Pseudonocardiaceae bacterium]
MPATRRGRARTLPTQYAASGRGTPLWRPSLVRAGLLGGITPAAGDRFEGRWIDQDGLPQLAEFSRHDQAVAHLARHATGALTFHGLRHSYATWLVDDGVPINMVQRVLGHERSSTTLDLYTRKTSNHDRIRDALDGYTGSTGSS